MIGALRDFFESVLFFLLTLLLGALFIAAIPVFGDLHGWLVMNEVSFLSRSDFIRDLLFGSAGICVLLGVLLMNWTPLLNPGIMSNLWATTYFFLWIDAVFALSIQFQSLKFMGSFGIGLAFIYLFFLTLNYLGFPNEKPNPRFRWKTTAVYFWMEGCMVFYFIFSVLLARQSFHYSGFHLPLALGAMVVCFLNYLLVLLLRKNSGEGIEKFSFAGRIFFFLWLAGLTLAWIGRKWIG